MPRINIPTIDVPPGESRREINEWAGSEESPDLAYLDALCQAFQYKMKNYYNAGATPEDRFQRLDEIRKALTEICFEDGGHTFTIAPIIDMTGGSSGGSVDRSGVGGGANHRHLRKNCPPGEDCVGGACVKRPDSN